jgi:hypothetical protein
VFFHPFVDIKRSAYRHDEIFDKDRELRGMGQEARGKAKRDRRLLTIDRRQLVNSIEKFQTKR